MIRVRKDRHKTLSNTDNVAAVDDHPSANLSIFVYDLNYPGDLSWT